MEKLRGAAGSGTETCSVPEETAHHKCCREVLGGYNTLPDQLDGKNPASTPGADFTSAMKSPLLSKQA